MQREHAEHSWFGPSALETSLIQPVDDQEDFKRLWQAFMTARLVLGMVLGGYSLKILLVGFLAASSILAIRSRASWSDSRRIRAR